MMKQVAIIWKGKEPGLYHLFDRIINDDDLRFLQNQINNLLEQKGESK